MKNGPQSNIELPPEDKEPKLPSIVVSLIGNETEEEKQTRSKKQVKFNDHQIKRSQPKKGQMKTFNNTTLSSKR